MANASSIPRSYEIDNTKTVPHTTRARQPETRAEWIARVVSEAPPLSDAQLDYLAVLLRPVIRQHRANATPTISMADYQSWEIRNHLTAGTHGTFTADGEAA